MTSVCECGSRNACGISRVAVAFRRALVHLIALCIVVFLFFLVLEYVTLPKPQKVR